jgi:L-ascorbate metabolism protein UlaG (beta-lactamase superfamily)
VGLSLSHAVNATNAKANARLSLVGMVRHHTTSALAARASVALALLAAALGGCTRYEAFPTSPEWRSGRFANPQSWPARSSVAEFLRWELGGRIGARPARFRGPYVENDGKALRRNREKRSFTWIGHATVLVQTAGVNVLTDPIFSDAISLILRRRAPPGVALADLPRIDVVVISHNHRDHLDEDSVRALGPDVLYVVPLGLGAWFRARKLTNVVELDWWQSTVIKRKLTITMVPAQHWSRRELDDENRSLWGGYVFDSGGERVFFAGDSGYPAAFAEVGRRFPGIGVAILPIGAYEPRWFMRSQHMAPEETARAFADLGARTLIPIHWGTFHLSDEPMDEPPCLLFRAMGGRANQILFLPIGRTWWPLPSEPSRH